MILEKTMFIPNQWYAVLDSSEVKSGKPYAFKRLGQELVFWRDDNGKVVAMRELCPHRQSKLSSGKIVDGNIQCTYHGFQYDSQGACQLIPANGRNGPRPKIFQCNSYPVEEGHGYIWLWNGEPRSEYPPLPYFEHMAGYTRSTIRRHWNTHETRAIESVLDVAHLPFIHAKTIGRGNNTLVNGPYTTLEGHKLRVWVSNQPDVGLPAIKPTEVPAPDDAESAMLLFNFPNVWQLYLDKTFINEIIFAPIDDDNTMLYVSAYQKIVNLPLLRNAFAYVSNLFNLYVLREDEGVVMTQRPKISGLDVGDRFIPADRPIAVYLQQRRDLILAAQQEPEVEQKVMTRSITIGKTAKPARELA